MTKTVSKAEKLSKEIDATAKFFKTLPRSKAKLLEALLDSMSSDSFSRFNDIEFEEFISGDLAHDLETTGMTSTAPALAECAREITLYRLSKVVALLLK